MTKRILLVLCVCVASSMSVFGQGTARSVYAIQGKLVFGSAKPPDDRIEVRLEKNMQLVSSTRTNAGGDFQFNSLSTGSYNIAVSLPGYDDVYHSVEVYGLTEYTTVTIEMTPIFKVVRKNSTGGDGDDPDVVDAKQLGKTYPKKAVQAYERAVEQAGKGETAKAVQYFEEALKIEPDFYHAQNNLGVAFLKLGQYGDAETAYRRASEMNPRSSQPFLNLGILYIQEADSRRAEGREVFGKLLDDAMDALDQAIKLRPQLALAHYYLGTAYYKSDFYPEAEASLKRARELDPTFGGSRVMLVNLYVKQRKLKSALEQIDAFIKENPKAPERKPLEDLRAKLVKGLDAPER